MTWRFIIALMGATTMAAACSSGPDADQFLSATELRDLVSDHTVYVPEWYIPACCNTQTGTLMYLAHDGTGWLDNQVLPGSVPRPGRMSMLLSWRAENDSRLCVWATPLIGEMPSFMSPSEQCFQMLRARKPIAAIQAAASFDGQSRTGWIELYPFNGFPPQVIDQYLTQVRVLYGGHIPIWTSAGPAQTAR